ncbi:hypothetical protein [Clostridium omnivorum]|uniref:Uncharacterized protein n=1 Tax=Clostridium omnivorum TaxID=1604902 RepID=A0ABQ5N990_9CLOT|nr:hypothetical protein [Clostridium sp. E14]GLC31793.1 hypothetical protein bsdE14_32030 [Clostridium sp. E14]
MIKDINTFEIHLQYGYYSFLESTEKNCDNLLWLVETMEKELLDFVDANPEDFQTAYGLFLDFVNQFEEQGYFREYDLEYDFDTIIAWAGSKDMLDSFELITLLKNTHVFTQDIRALGVEFYNHEQMEDKAVVTEASAKILRAFEGYLKKQLELHAAIVKSFRSYSETLYLHEEILAAYDNYLHVRMKFLVDEGLKSHALKCNDDIIFEATPDKGLLHEMQTLKKQKKNWKGSSLYFVAAIMGKIGDDYYESSSRRSAETAFEAALKLKDIAIDFIWENTMGEVLDYDAAATIFAVFLFVCEEYCIKKDYDESYVEPLTAQDILGYVEDGNFQEYLKLVEEKDFDSALFHCPDYKIAYYYKLFNLLCKLPSADDLYRLTYNQTDTIYGYLEHLDYELYSNLGNSSVGYYLPSLVLNSTFELDFDVFLKTLDTTREKNLVEKNLREDLQRVINKNNKMVDDFSHIWTNIIKPNAIYKVAEALAQHEEFRDYYVTLMQVYNDEIMMQNECEILKLSHSANPIQLQAYLRKGISKSSTAVGLPYFIDYAFKRVLLRVFFDNSSRCQWIRNSFSSSGLDTHELMASFEKQVLQGNTEVFHWFTSKAFEVSFSIDESLSPITIDPTSGCASFLIGRFMELFFNALTYGKKGSASYINLVLTTNTVDALDYISIEVLNPVEDRNIFTGGNKKGLEAMDEFMRMLNGNKKLKSVQASIFEDIYSIKVLLDKGLISDEEEDI